MYAHSTQLIFERRYWFPTVTPNFVQMNVYSLRNSIGKKSRDWLEDLRTKILHLKWSLSRTQGRRQKQKKALYRGVYPHLAVTSGCCCCPRGAPGGPSGEGEPSGGGSDWLFSESEQEPEVEPFFLPSPEPLCVFTCLERWSDRINRLLQTWQANRFSPVWVRKWRCNSSDRVNLFPQNSQLQTKGRSPVCQRKWAFRCDVLP